MFPYINERIRSLIVAPEKRRLVENLISLSTLQGLNYILPLITVPYLVRILGPGKFGLISFAQAFVQYFAIFTDYGFNLSATRKISINRENKQRVSEIVSAVFLAKLCFMLIGYLGLAGLVLMIPKFNKDATLYFFTYGIVLGNVLFPLWFFQGMERMKYITLLTFVSKVIFTASIFLLIKRTIDYLYVPLITSSGNIVAGCISLWVLRNKFHIRLTLPTFKIISDEIIDGWHVFISTVAISSYTISSIFILGLFSNDAIVGYYSAAEKIVRSVLGLLTPISQTVYPYISKLASESKEKAIGFAKRLVNLVGKGTFLISLLLLLFSKPIVAILLGKQFQRSLAPLRILAFLPFIVGLSNIFGIQIMLAFNLKKAFSRILVSASLINITLTVLLTPRFNMIGTSCSLLVTEIFVTVTMYLYLSAKNIKMLSIVDFLRRK